MARVTVDGVGQVGFRPGGVVELVEAQLGRQVEQLGGLVPIVDRLSARLVERDELVVFLGVPVGLAQGDKRFGVGGVPLQSCLGFVCGRHTWSRLSEGRPSGKGGRQAEHVSTGCGRRKAPRKMLTN